MSATWTGLWRRPMVGNALSLYAVQGLNYLVPLLLVPYLLRTLGTNAYGSIVFSQALIGYVVVVTDYGFNLTAARDISVAREDPTAVARIYWTIMAAKLLLLLVSLAVVSIIALLTPALRHAWPVTACCAVTAIGSVALPQWYFQGTERLREMAVVQALSKAATAAGLIVWVHSPADVLGAALLLSAPQLAAAIAALLIGQRLTPGAFFRPKARDIGRALKSGWHLFVGGAAVALYGHTNTFVLGILCGDQAVAVFNVGYRLVTALQSLVNPVIQAVYPRASLLFDQDPRLGWELVRSVARLLLPGIAAASLLLALVAPSVVDLVGGHAFGQAAAVTRILCLTPPCVTAAMLLAQCVMVTNGLTQPLVRIYMAVGALNLLVLPLLVTCFAAQGAALSLVLAELLGPALMLRIVMQLKPGTVQERAS